MRLKITYLWGIEDKNKWYSLTGSSTLFELIGKNKEKLVRVLVDYWSFQGSKNEKLKNKDLLVDDLETLDAVIVTHAHLDHIWRIPYLVKNWFSWRIYISPLTLELAKLNWKDTIWIAKAESEKSKHFKSKMRDYLKILKLYEKLKKNNIKKHERGKIRWQLEDLLDKYNTTVDKVTEKLESLWIKTSSDIKNINQCNILFDEVDLQRTLELVSTLSLEDEVWINEYLKLKFFDAAHIEGSVMPVLEFFDKKWKSYKCLIAQDLWRFKDNPLWKVPCISTNFKLNYIQLESTYAWRYHPEMSESIKKFVDAIKNHRWPILIPAFSIQRTQFILKLLLNHFNELWNRKIYTTSELAQQVNQVFLTRKRNEYKYLLDRKIKFLTPDNNISKSVLNRSIIVWSSGMLQWWSIERWLKELVKNPNTKIIFTWYQWEWTRWREIIDWKDFIIIDWKAIPVRCKYEYIKGFSSHADTEDMITFLKKFKKYRWQKIKLVLTHWWDNRYVFKEILSSSTLKNIKKQYDIHIAKIKESLSIKI